MDVAGRGSQRRNTERWQAELHQRWPYGLGAATIGVLLPVVAGFPDVHAQVGVLRGEFSLGIVATMVAAAVVLCLAAMVDRARRSLWFAVALLALIVAHPILETAFENRAAHVIRMMMAATVIVVRAARQASGGVALIVVRLTGSILALTGVALCAAASAGAPDPADELGMIILAMGAVSIGGIDFVLGQREVDGAAIALSMAMLSFGYGSLLLLSSGGVELTAGVAIFGTVTAVCTLAGAVLAIVEALARRDVRLDALRLSVALADARLRAQSERFAVTSHDQRGALMAIEAAAQRLEDGPDQALAAAVAAEAARLQRGLTEQWGGVGLFDVGEALEPMLVCMRAMGVELTFSARGDPRAWGSADEIIEVVRGLVDNARTHGVAPIRVEASRLGPEVLVSVADSGGGVSPSLAQAIFEQGVTTDPSRHSGLGLHSGREIAERYGGSLSLAVTRVATFELRLATRPAPPAPAIGEDLPEADVISFRRTDHG